MQINTEKWGLESEWQVDTNLSTASWQDTNLLFYNGKYSALSDYRTANVFDYNTPIDYTIAYGAHAAAEQMPLADIAIYDYQGAKKYTQESNNGWFLTEQNSLSSSGWHWYELLTSFENGTPANLYNLGGAYRWSPDAVNSGAYYPYPYNNNRLLRPVVKFSPKSFFGVVYVQLVKNDYTDMIQIPLKTLKNNIATYESDYFIMKAYMRMYAYNGRVSQDGNYNNYVLKSLNGLGVGTTSPIEVGSKELVTYYQTVGISYYTFPIAGTIEYVQNYYYGTNHYGVRVAPLTTDSGGGSEHMQGVTMAHLVESTNVQYFYSPNTTGHTYVLQVKITINADNIEELYKGAAAYGFFFSDDVNGLNADTTNVARWLNENMYCGVLDENGVGHGEYTKGFSNATNPIFLWDSNQDSPYDPSRPPSPIDQNTYDNTTVFPTILGVATGTIQYVLNELEVMELIQELYTIIGNWTGVTYAEIMGKATADFLVSEPIKSIVSLIAYPFQPNLGAATTVHLGRTDTEIDAYYLSRVIETINFNGIDIFPKFGNSFLDYEPYTKYEVYVPFCGTVKLSAGDILGHTLNIKLKIDMQIGVCTGYILADALCIETVTGTCGVQCPISGEDTTAINANIVYANIQRKSAETASMAALPSFTPSGVISALTNPLKTYANIEQSALNVEQANYDLKHIPADPHSIGSASPLTAWCMDMTARLYIYYPEGNVIDSSQPPSAQYPRFKDDELEAFGKVKGFATLSAATVNSFHGFTQGTIKADQIPCTESERSRIKEAFANGVFLPYP